MTNVASPSAPRNIPGAGLTLVPPTSPLPPRSSRNGQLGPEGALSPVAQNGSFEFDRIIKEGEVSKRTRKTKSWKPIYIVLRPNLLSIYRDRNETKLRHQINLSDLTAVARQKDPKRKEKAVFALFSPSKNYHLEARSEEDAEEWMNVIRREARLDDDEDEIYLMSPGGANSSPYQAFGRGMTTQISPTAGEESTVGYASSSEAEGLSPSYVLPKTRDKAATTTNTARQPSFASYSGADHGSVSDFSDVGAPAARMSALSLTNTDPRPSTSSTRPPQLSASYTSAGTRPQLDVRSVSQMSGFGLSAEEVRRAQNPGEEERVVYHGWIYLLKSRSGIRQWKKVWLVARPKGVAIYKGEEEYTALLILPFSSIIDAVEIDPISRSKTLCMQIISEERNYKFCALDEESSARCLGALKSLIAKRKAKQKEKEAAAAVPAVTVAS